jgi:hypothetical protein
VDFKFEQVKKLEDGSYAPVTTVVANATGKDHEDIHYLYKLRKAIVLLIGEENMKGFSVSQLEDIHSAIVTSMVSSDKAHWYNDYYDGLDETLSEDLKEKSDGYYKPEKKGMFNLEDNDERICFETLKSEGCEEVWIELDQRENAPINIFLDSENKKYPYRNRDGSINTKALSVLCDYFDGRGGVIKRPLLGARAKRLFVKSSGE